MRRLWHVIAVFCISAAILTGCGSGPRLMMGTGSPAGTYSAFGSVLARYMTEYAGCRVTAVPTDASKANIQSMEDGDYQLALAQSDVLQYAWEGSRSFEEDGASRAFRVLGGLYEETVQLVTTDSRIRTVEDLRGHTVSVGAPGSGVSFNALDILEVAGLSLEDIEPQYLDFEKSREALLDGTVDAAFIVAGTPTGVVEEMAAALAEETGIYLVPVDGGLREDLLKICPFYAPSVIPAGTYAGQEEAVETISVKAALIVRADMPEEDVYRLTAAVFDHTEEIAREHGAGEELSVQNAAEGIGVPFHAGAARYYSEHGVKVETADAEEEEP